MKWRFEHDPDAGSSDKKILSLDGREKAVLTPTEAFELGWELLKWAVPFVMGKATKR